MGEGRYQEGRSGEMSVCGQVEGQPKDLGFPREQCLHEAGPHNEGQGHGAGLPNTVSRVSLVFWPGSLEWLLRGHNFTDRRPRGLGGLSGISTVFVGLWGILTGIVRSPPFTNEGTGARRGEVTCSESHSGWLQNQEVNSTQFGYSVP